MVQKHIIVSMIAPVAIAGILIMAILANQAYSSSGSLTSVKCKITKHGHTKCKTKTITPPQGATSQQSSNAGTTVQGATNGNAAHTTTNYHPEKYHWGPWGHGKFRWHGNWWHNKRCFFGPRGQVRCMYR